MLGHRRAPALVLMVATLVWGGSFVITRGAVQAVTPLAFLTVRFAVAACVVGVLTRPGLARLTRTECRGGLMLGLAMFGGYGMQALGMHAGVSSGRAAFISAVYVPIVPVLQLVILRRRPGAAVWAGLALACAGLVVMAGPLGHAAAGWAEALVLVGAFAIAAEILLVGVFASRVDPRRLAVVECLVVAGLCAAGLAVTGQGWPAPRMFWVGPACLLGLGSAGLQIAVNWAQRFVPPARATLIYTLEPVWAALFGALAGERMGLGAIAGAVLILASLLVSSLEGKAPAESKAELLS